MALLAGCGNGKREAAAAEAMAAPDRAAEERSAPSSFVEREFWLALAGEPGWHMNAARDEFLAGNPRQASGELEKVAAILNFEIRHSHSPKERGLLLGSIQELREVARDLRNQEGPDHGPVSLAELDRVSALAFRTLGAHHVTLGRDALEAGDGRMAGLYIQETVKAIRSGFERGGIETGEAMEVRLRSAEEVAERLTQDGDGSHEMGLASLAHLDGGVEGLGNVLTSRRK
jgi:hypothetical protein